MEITNLPLSEIVVFNRTRKDFPDEYIKELADSIKTFGLINPIMVDRNKNLVAGECRLRAHVLLGSETIPVVFADNVDEITAKMIELEENVRRRDMTWQERAMGVWEVHTLRQRTAHKVGETWEQKHTGALLGVERSLVSKLLSVAERLIKQDEEICKASSLTDALTILVKRREDEANKELAKRAGAFLGETRSGESGFRGRHIDFAVLDPSGNEMILDLSKKPKAKQEEDSSVASEALIGELSTVYRIKLANHLKHGDCCDHMKKMPEEFVDHIITDAPYGIEVQNFEDLKNIERVADEHRVDDNVELLEDVFPLMFKVLKPGGFLCMFYDMDHHEKLQRWATEAGFKTQRWPLIARKRTAKNNAAGFNFTKDYEVCLIARKGLATLRQVQQTSIREFDFVTDTKEFGNPFAKPFDLWKWLIEAVAIPGQCIYDPFAGAGSSIRAFILHGMIPLASEKTEHHFNELVRRTKEAYEKLTRGKVEFE